VAYKKGENLPTLEMCMQVVNSGCDHVAVVFVWLLLNISLLLSGT